MRAFHLAQRRLGHVAGVEATRASSDRRARAEAMAEELLALARAVEKETLA